MPLIATRGAASAQGFGEFAQTTAPVYIEDVFSTYLYTGNGGTTTITNNIDLSTKGGLVWVKSRTNNAGAFFDHELVDTVRGRFAGLNSNTTAAADGDGLGGGTFQTTGFSVVQSAKNLNNSSNDYVSWTFREQPKFFDIVTYTGDGSNRTISHNLGSVPGCMIIKRTDTTGNWATYHRSLGNQTRLYLNTTDAAVSGTSIWQSTTPTSTEFYVDNNSNVNANGGTYVAYLFAHNAGGFGLTGSDNVISCGSFTAGAGGTVNLGWEPQWILVKSTSTTGNVNFDGWMIFDSMRGYGYFGDTNYTTNASTLRANTSAAEVNGATDYGPRPTATGFQWNAYSGTPFIYIAIRRGPMKTPTTGTSVFTPVAYTGNGSTRSYSVGFPTDLSINMTRSFAGDAPTWNDRLRGTGNDLYSSSTQAESAAGSAGVQFDNNTNIIVPNYRIINGDTYIDWCMRRAPGFFDVACYTGDAAATNNQNHNLGVTPEMLIFKSRNNADNWAVFFPVQDTFTRLNSTSGKLNGSSLPSAVTSTTFNVGNTTGYSSVASVNISGYTYVTYLFASVAGVSKVGSYTGTGTTLQVNCGFTNGSRFVLIKRTDSTGDWYVWDSARGIVAGNDPYLLLNSSAAEVTNTDYVDTYSAGFEISSTAPAAINANGGTFIFLAIA